MPAKAKADPDVTAAQHANALARIRKLEQRLDALISQIGAAVSLNYVDPTVDDEPEEEE